jgi:H+/Cl- antiporter ClcA
VVRAQPSRVTLVRLTRYPRRVNRAVLPPLAWFGLGVAIGVVVGLCAIYGVSRWRAAVRRKQHQQRKDGNGATDARDGCCEGRTRA